MVHLNAIEADFWCTPCFLVLYLIKLGTKSALGDSFILCISMVNLSTLRVEF